MIDHLISLTDGWSYPTWAWHLFAVIGAATIADRLFAHVGGRVGAWWRARRAIRHYRRSAPHNDRMLRR